MFYYVKGPVAHIAPYLAVIDCGGVGYACHTTANTLSYLKKGEVTKLYTYLHVREELFDLYGFSTEEERSCFELLIGVSGVGPKAALSILSATSPEGLAMRPLRSLRVSAKKLPSVSFWSSRISWRKASSVHQRAANSTGEPGSRSFRKINLLRPPPPWLCWATVRLKLPSP